VSLVDYGFRQVICHWNVLVAWTDNILNKRALSSHLTHCVGDLLCFNYVYRLSSLLLSMHVCFMLFTLFDFSFVACPSVLWYCWLGLLTCKNHLPYNLYCVGGDVKHCSLTYSLTLWLVPRSGLLRTHSCEACRACSNVRCCHALSSASHSLALSVCVTFMTVWIVPFCWLFSCVNSRIEYTVCSLTYRVVDQTL